MKGYLICGVLSEDMWKNYTSCALYSSRKQTQKEAEQELEELSSHHPVLTQPELVL